MLGLNSRWSSVKELTMVVFNLTKEPVVTYAEGGEMIKLYPIGTALRSDFSKREVAFLVSDSEYENLSSEQKKSKIYVRATGQGSGRNGIEIVTLISFRKNKDGEMIRLLPAGKATYKRIAPQGSYQFLKT